MFGWGSNDYGQLGCGTGKIISNFQNIVGFFFETLRPEKQTFPALDWPKDKADQ